MRAPFMCVAALLLTAVGLAANAQDQNITINYTLYADQSVTFHYFGDTESNYACPFSGYLSSNPTQSFNVYCIDLTHGQYNDSTQQVSISQINQNSTVQTTNPLVSSQELKEASWLIDQYDSTPISDSLSQSAVQLAVWAVVSGDTGFGNSNYNLDTSGQNFWIDGTSVQATTLTDVNTYLTNLGAEVNKGLGGGNGTLFELDPQDDRITNSGQNVLGGGGYSGQGNSNYSPSPEGSTLAMFALGMTPLFGTFWFKRRNKSGEQPIA